MITIKRIEAPDFESISEKWNAFIKTSSNDNIFLTHEWLISWWQAFRSADRAFYFLIAYDSQQNIVGALPLQLVSKRFARVLQLKVLQFIGRGIFDFHETEYNTFMTPPTRPGLEAHVYAAAAEYLDLHKNDWDLLVLTNLLSTHPSTPVFECELKKKFKMIRSKQENNYVIALAPTYDAFLEGLSRNQRRSFRRRSKGIQKDKDACFTIIAKDQEIENYLENYYQLVSQRHNWVPSKEKELFLETLCRKLAGAGWLKCYSLALNTIPAATVFGFRYNNKYYAYKAAFNPEFFSLSPGTALYAFAIQDEIAHGSREIDYLIGEYAYKQYWCNEVRAIDYIEIVGERMQSRFKVHLCRAISGIMASIGRVRTALRNGFRAFSPRS